MELEKILSHFLDGNGKLTSFPAKRKMKIYALMYIATKFESGKEYTESEVNDIINYATAFNDSATIRRELYNYKFFSREKDGSHYRLESEQPVFEGLSL